MLPSTPAGLPGAVRRAPGFAPASEAVIGNPSPAWTGSPGNTPQAPPGPHPAWQPIGGQLGTYDGNSGADPAMPAIQPHPHVSYLNEGQESFVRWGIQGFNDQLQVRDRHVYWDRGSQRFGWSPSVPGNPPNPHTDGPAAPNLRAVNISLNPQIGSSASRNQDDLSRPYTWLGQQDGTVQPVYGGVPGLWASYGNRGFAAGIHDPSNGQGGTSLIYPGPPHGLHSDTLPAGKQIADRYKATPQMRPARIDRPSNSTIAGQSYSQTVQFQGAASTARAASPTVSARASVSARAGGRGWAGR